MADVQNVKPGPVPIKNPRRLTANQVAFLYAMPPEPQGVVVRDPEWLKFAQAMVMRGYGYWGNRVNGHITFYLTLAGRNRLAELKGSPDNAGEYQPP